MHLCCPVLLPLLLLLLLLLWHNHSVPLVEG
jgi:hypothetical protein